MLSFIYNMSNFAMGILALFMIFIVYIIHVMVINPYLRVLYYRKQGGVMYFKPGLGIADIDMKNVRENGDFYYREKKIIKENPNLPFVGGNMATMAVVTLLQPQLIKEFIAIQEKYYEKADLKQSLLIELFGSGLLSSEREIWRKHRKIVSSVFHFEFLKQRIPIIIQTANEVFDNLIKQDKLKNVNIMNEFQNITGEVVGKAFFGNTMPMMDEYNKPMTTVLAKLISDVTLIGFTLSGILFGKEFVKLGLTKSHRDIMQRIRKFKAFCRDVVEKRKQEFLEGNAVKARNDLLQALFESQAKNSEEFLSTEEIIDEFITFFIGGMDTTGHSLTMMLYYLLQNPEYLEKVKVEGSELLAQKPFGTEDLNKMTFTTAAIKETLRMTTPAPAIFLREALVDHKLGSISIKKGTQVTLGLILNNFNEKYFPDPYVFSPNRWLDSMTPDKIEPYSFIPFSSGPRNCIGQHLATMEMKIILSIFLSRFIPKMPSNYELKMDFTFLYEPLNPIMLELAPIV